MAATTQGLDPFVAHLPVVEPLRRETAAQLNSALIQEPPESLDCGLLRPGEAVLLRNDPVDFWLGDHPRTQGFEEQLAEGHDPCNEVVTFCTVIAPSAKPEVASDG